jgi:TorA maturation chaperone TorD
MNAVSAQAYTHTASRASLYAFLAWLFLKQPDEDFVTRLQASDIQGNLHTISSSSASMSRMIAGLNAMRSSLVGSSSRTQEGLCQALAVEHTRYLRGVGRAYGTLPPYESLFRPSWSGEDQSLLLQLAEFYHQAQAVIPGEIAERVDYLGVELDFMHLLCNEANLYGTV